MGTPVDTNFTRRNNGNFSVVDDADIGGGLKVVATTAARDAILSNLRKPGMLVAVQSPAIAIYQLQLDGVTWLPFSGSAGTNDVGTIIWTAGVAWSTIAALIAAVGGACTVLLDCGSTAGFSTFHLAGTADLSRVKFIANGNVTTQVANLVADPGFTLTVPMLDLENIYFTASSTLYSGALGGSVNLRFSTIERLAGTTGPLFDSNNMHVFLDDSSAVNDDATDYIFKVTEGPPQATGVFGMVNGATATGKIIDGHQAGGSPTVHVYFSYDDTATFDANTIGTHVITVTTVLSQAAVVGYTPTTLSDWSTNPATVNAALNALGVTMRAHVYAVNFAGADLGAQINAADLFLGSAPGVIEVPDGNYTISTQANVGLHGPRVLRFGNGTISTTTAVPPITWDSNVTIEGKGWGTVIREPTSTIMTTIISRQSTINNNNDGESNIVIRDLQIQGPYATGFNSAPSALTTGNSHNVHIDNVWIHSTKSIGLNVGGASSSGFHATDTWVTNCRFTSVASQSIGAVNVDGLHVNGCKFDNPGQVGGPGSSFLDCEANQTTDVIRNIQIVGNVFDGSNGPGLGNAILVQTQLAPGAWPSLSNSIVIAGNTINGANSTLIGEGISNGIFTTNATGVQITGNIVRRVGQCAVSLNGSNWNNVSGNFFENVGGGGTPAVAVSASSYNVFNANTLVFDYETNSGNSSTTVQETLASDFNDYNNFTIRTNYAPGVGGNGFILTGTNSRVRNLSIDGQNPIQISPAIVGGATIAPTGLIHHITTNTTTIQTITPPISFGVANFGGKVTLIFDVVAPWNALGNVAVAGTPTIAGTSVEFTYDFATLKWYPSRIS